jgi:hypothetical protein
LGVWSLVHTAHPPPPFCATRVYTPPSLCHDSTHLTYPHPTTTFRGSSPSLGVPRSLGRWFCRGSRLNSVLCVQPLLELPHELPSASQHGTRSPEACLAVRSALVPLCWAPFLAVRSAASVCFASLASRAHQSLHCLQNPCAQVPPRPRRQVPTTRGHPRALLPEAGLLQQHQHRHPGGPAPGDEGGGHHRGGGVVVGAP